MEFRKLLGVVTLAVVTVLPAREGLAQSALRPESGGVGGDVIARLRAENDSLRRELARYTSKPAPATTAPAGSARTASVSTASADVLRLIPAPVTTAHPGTVTVEYDRFKNHTVAKLDELEVGGFKDDLGLRILYIMDGQSPTVPSLALMTLQSHSENWQYLRCHDLSLLVDGKPFELPETTHDGRVGSGYVLEFMTTRLPIRSFLQLANAKTIEGKLCTTEFTLREPQMQALRDLASRMKPAP